MAIIETIKTAASKVRAKVRYEMLSHELRVAQSDMAALGVHIGQIIRKKEKLKRELSEAEKYQIEQNLDHWTAEPF